MISIITKADTSNQPVIVWDLPGRITTERTWEYEQLFSPRLIGKILTLDWA
ncbi:MAG: hypothetical protein DSM106950_21505 [Stigonema ocellatum SAG 48.90 = DSM 106950]|nr:hypothetical protein [Stigonema ocellatum SAG 48.90 = DSM 106950]